MLKFGVQVRFEYIGMLDAEQGSIIFTTCNSERMMSLWLEKLLDRTGAGLVYSTREIPVIP